MKLLSVLITFFFPLFVNGQNLSKCYGGYSSVYTTGITTSVSGFPVVINVTAFPWDTVRISGSWSASYCPDISGGSYIKDGTPVYNVTTGNSYYDVTQSGVYQFEAGSYPPDKTFNVTFVTATGISDFENKDFLLAPVPAKDFITIKCPYHSYDFVITDLSGKMVFNTRSENSTEQLDISAFVPGIYLARFSDTVTGQWKCKKFIKM